MTTNSIWEQVWYSYSYIFGPFGSQSNLLLAYSNEYRMVLHNVW